MATLYTKRGIWYLSVSANKQRIARSLGTRDRKLAVKLKPGLELELLYELLGLAQNKTDMPFTELAAKYLKSDHGWSKRTKELNDYVFSSYLSGKPLPSNPTSRAIFVRTINTAWNWGIKKGLVQKAHKLEGDTKGEVRSRVFSSKELQLLFENIIPSDFNAFVRFAYYTGARSGEIRQQSDDEVYPTYLQVHGKTGKRIIKLNSQAQDLLNKETRLWSYTKNYVSNRFKSECRRLGSRNARFHDLRRTFGYNLVRQGMPIYEVSKLLGHSSVRTTEQHYAPLLTVEIEDFEL